MKKERTLLNWIAVYFECNAVDLRKRWEPLLSLSVSSSEANRRWRHVHVAAVRANSLSELLELLDQRESPNIHPITEDERVPYQK